MPITIIITKKLTKKVEEEQEGCVSCNKVITKEEIAEWEKEFKEVFNDRANILTYGLTCCVLCERRIRAEEANGSPQR
jgi:hypothetical protein